MPSDNSNDREIAIRVAGLLVHYWTADDDRAIRKQQILDWVYDLREFHLSAIEGACITWRQQHNKRPTTADIRKLILPDPVTQPDIPGGAAYNQTRKSRLTLEELQKHRKAIAPLWKLVQRARGATDAQVEHLIRIRHRFSRKMFRRDPDLQRINAIIELEEKEERDEWIRARREACTRNQSKT